MENYSMEVTPSPKGRKLQFTPEKDVTNATLRITLYGPDGKLMDREELRYDYPGFLKVPAKLELSTEKKQYVLGEKIPYSIRFSDMNDRPLVGRVLMYVIDSKGRVVDLTESREVSGSITGLLEIPSAVGEYGFIIREVSRDLKSETSFAVLPQPPDSTQVSASTTLPETLSEALPEETTPEERGNPPGSYLYPAVGIIVLAFIILFVLAERKRK